MKNIYKLKTFTLLFLLIGIGNSLLFAQPCGDPIEIIEDDFSAYTLGDVASQAAHWDMWPGASASGMVSNNFGYEDTLSLRIAGDIAGQDVLLNVGPYLDGHYIIAWKMYVPSGKSAYFNLQHEAPTSSAGFWGFDVFLNDGGSGILDLFGGNEHNFSFPQDTWFSVIIFADIDSDEARLLINENVVAAWAFSNGVTNGGADYPSSQLTAINYYPIDEGHEYYIDELIVAQLPPASEGYYCYTAVEAVVGMNTVPDLGCFGAGYDVGVEDPDEGLSGYWFTYAPDADGVISMASCNQGVDTRCWIFDGDCHSLVIKGVNDDQCDIGSGSIWASYREAVVQQGQTYLIMWDNVWENGGFSFELTFSEDSPAEGKFCESAIPVDIGEHLLTEMDGDAAMAGPNINNLTSSTTPYSKSKWYVYTPDSTGTARVTSCDGTTSDTHVFIYTGECGNFETLSLYASNDDGDACTDNQSDIEFEVEAGTSYYIEWIDRWDEDAFLWTLCFNGNCVAVDVDEITLENGLQLFPNPATEVLNLQFDLPEIAQDVQVSIFNATGTQLKHYTLGDIQQQLMNIDIADLATGLYFVQINAANAQLTKKVVIE